MLSASQLREQRDILMLLYRTTGGEKWDCNNNWDDDSQPVSSFYGVTVDDSTGAVIEIFLGDNGLSGTT